MNDRLLEWLELLADGVLTTDRASKPFAADDVETARAYALMEAVQARWLGERREVVHEMLAAVRETTQSHERELQLLATRDQMERMEAQRIQEQAYREELEEQVRQRTRALQEEMEARKQAEERNLQSQKMEAIGRLAGGVAHDFNNLLTVIMNFSCFIRDGEFVKEQVQSDIEEVLLAGQKASSLTRQLLLFSRQQPAAVQLIGLAESLRGMQRLLERTIGEDVVLVVLAPDEPLYVLADATQLDQILLNLAINGRDAMPDGGKLQISAVAAATDGEGEAFAEPHVRIEVSDTGVGMDEATKAHIFEPFYTTKLASSGTGLGLATCYGIVQQLGGSIEVVTDPGQGTTFRVFLPTRVDAELPVQLLAPVGIDPAGNETVLVIEDEAEIRKLAARTLSRHGYQVLSAEDGVAGLELFEQYQDAIDLVFTDVVLPRGSGFEVVKRVQELRPDVAVLLTTGYTDRMADCGVAEVGMFWKPYAPDELVSRIRLCLNRRRLKK
ncbi:MAG: signal transduction histidine kinase [Myxococcota bacterium]|jgi:signal transduction histidine kinase